MDQIATQVGASNSININSFQRKVRDVISPGKKGQINGRDFFSFSLQWIFSLESVVNEVQIRFSHGLRGKYPSHPCYPIVAQCLPQQGIFIYFFNACNKPFDISNICQQTSPAMVYGLISDSWQSRCYRDTTTGLRLNSYKSKSLTF